MKRLTQISLQTVFSLVFVWKVEVKIFVLSKGWKCFIAFIACCIFNSVQIVNLSCCHGSSQSRLFLISDFWTTLNHLPMIFFPPFLALAIYPRKNLWKCPWISGRIDSWCELTKFCFHNTFGPSIHARLLGLTLSLSLKTSLPVSIYSTLPILLFTPTHFSPHICMKHMYISQLRFSLIWQHIFITWRHPHHATYWFRLGNHCM